MKKTVAHMISIAVLFSAILFVGSGRAQRGPTPGLPDLTVTMGKKSVSGTLEVGQMISLMPTVTNNGSTAVPGYRLVLYFSNQSLMLVQDIPQQGIPGSWKIDEIEVSAPLGPGASAQPKIKDFHIPDDFSWGDYYVTAIVDSGKKIPESNESNNKSEVQLFIQADIDYIDQEAHLGFCCHGKGFGAWKSGLIIRIGSYSFPADPSQWKNTEVHYRPQCGIIPPAPAYEQGLFFGSKAIAKTSPNSWGITIWRCVPEQGPTGTPFTLEDVYCAGASQGTKKLELRTSNSAYQFIANITVTSWSNNSISGVIPNVAPGKYTFAVTDGGNLLSFYPFTAHLFVN